MPIYEFHCKDCRTDFRKLTRAGQTASPACPTCGAERVVRVLSVTAPHTTGASDMAACGMDPQGTCCGLQPGGCGCRN